MIETLDEALRAADDPEVRAAVQRFLLDLLRVPTAVGPDLARVRADEGRAFDLITGAIELILGCWRGLERVPIDPRIEAHPYYTRAHYTKTDERPEGLSAAATYEGRSNLVLRLPGQGRGTLAFNAHIDVVEPYVEPRFEGGVFYGRGACDDKGQCAVMLLALYLIEQARYACDITPPADLLFEFVIDEEPGGNGSLSLALDRRFVADAMVVLEATDLAVHPANRGAVWYRLVLDTAAAPAIQDEGLAAALVLALEQEGAAIKAESDHPLFPHRPVQTCHGILGPWGKHPSVVNDHVEVAITFEGRPLVADILDVVDDAVAAYCSVYGDKTKEPDPETGKPKVARHYDLEVEGQEARLVVHGRAGHMGATPQCDNAITKAAYIIRALETDGSLAVQGMSVGPGGPNLVLEGGQGFLPTHSLDEVTERMRRAVAHAARACCEKHGVAYDPKLATMTFEKLHNDAFARDANDPAVRAFVEAARGVGIPVEEPLRGWDVSCDARIFAREYPDAAVITFGAGSLEHAHALDEQVRLNDLVTAAKAIARFALACEPQPSPGGVHTRGARRGPVGPTCLPG